MANMRISDIPAAASLHDGDIFEIAQVDSGSTSGYMSFRTTLILIANYVAKLVQYTSDLQTTDKTVIGAINELKRLISLIPQFSIEVVQALPTEDISDTTIYLVPAEDPETGNYYEEYIHVNDAWELVGTTAVDLSAYYTKLEVDGLLATKANAADVTAALATKENKTDMPTDVRTIIKDCKTTKNATITNGIAQFECIEENLVKGLKVTMNPIQDLHGYSNPWAGGAGKNKLHMTVANIKAENTAGTWSGNVYTLFGVDFTVQTDGDENVIGIKAYGTSTRQINFVLKTNLNILNTDLILNGTPSGLSGVSALYAKTTQTYYDNGSGVSFNSGSGIVETIIVVNNGKTIDAAYKPMIRLSTETDATFAPYSNICPISGRTEVSVTRTAGEDVETKTHQYSETIYGGVDDFVNGGATSEQGKLVLDGTENWTADTARNGVYYLFNTMASSIYADCVCDRFKTIHSNAEMQSLGIAFGIQNKAIYIPKLFDGAISGVTDVASWKTYLSNNNMEITYPLATPTTILTSAEEINTVAGTNIISGTEPISECKYTELATVDDLIKIIGGAE